MAKHLPPPLFENKIVSYEALKERAGALPHPIVMTNGVFDVLHRGHVTYLAQARALGKSLIVAVNSDASVRLLAATTELKIYPRRVLRQPGAPRPSPLPSNLIVRRRPC